LEFPHIAATASARALVVLSTWTGAVAPVQSFAEEPIVARPRVKVDDTWKYSVRRTDAQQRSRENVYDFKVTFVGPTAIKAVSTMANGEEIDTTWTPEWNVVTDGRAGSFYPDTGLLKFPLQPGATYSTKYEVVRPRQGQFDSKLAVNMKVVGWQQITVKAGTFRALKLEGTGTYERVDKVKGGAGTIHYSIWYVPEIQRWAKFDFETKDQSGKVNQAQSEELLSFKLQ